jgi:hypothetical protein
MGLRTILKTAGHWLKGSIVKVDSEIQFDTVTNPEIDSTGGNFVWNTQTSNANSWKLRDPGVTEDIISVDTSAKTFTLHPNYTGSGFSSGGADIPEIKGTSINYMPYGNGALTGGLSGSPSELRGVVFDITGNVSSTGIILEVVVSASATLHLAVYKYDYTNDIWNIATEQLDISMAATGLVSQNFTTPQALTAGKYCIAWRPSDTISQILGFYKLRSRNNLTGDFASMTTIKNRMETGIITYSAIMPATITFPSALFTLVLYCEVFQIKF